MQCCPNADARKITREEHEDARQVARDIAKTKQYAISMRLRKKVEMLFAHLQRFLGLGRLRLRGPNGANDEFLLAANVQTLIEKERALCSEPHFLHQQHVVFPQNWLIAATRCNCEIYKTLAGLGTLKTVTWPSVLLAYFSPEVAWHVVHQFRSLIVYPILSFVDGPI